MVENAWHRPGHACRKTVARETGRSGCTVRQGARADKPDAKLSRRKTGCLDHALAYNLANCMRTLALPMEVEHWSLITLREKVVKIGAKVVRHGRYVTFQSAEVAVSRDLFGKF